MKPCKSVSKWGECVELELELVVLSAVPPSTPLLLSTGSNQHSLQLQWKLGDDGGSPVRGFALHFKAEHGEWEEHRVDGTIGSPSANHLAGNGSSKKFLLKIITWEGEVGLFILRQLRFDTLPAPPSTRDEQDSFKF